MPEKVYKKMQRDSVRRKVEMLHPHNLLSAERALERAAEAKKTRQNVLVRLCLRGSSLSSVCTAVA